MSFFLFILIVFLNNPVSAVSSYAINLFFIVTLIIYLLLLDGLKFKVSLSLAVGLLFCSVFIISMSLVNTHIYVVVLCLKILVLVEFFRRASLTLKEFLDFINFCFFVYFILSILFWVFIPDGRLNTRIYNEEFTINLFGLSYQILSGLKGSPSHIDSYSAVILILNLTISMQQRYRGVVVLCALAGILLSFRMTPMVGLLMIFLLKPFLKKRWFFLSFNIIGFFAFIFLIFILYYKPDFMLFNTTSISEFAYMGTSARSQIWHAQTEIMLKTYSFFQYFSGGFRIDTFSVPLFQLWGADTGRVTSNPHSTYLLLIFRSPFLFICLLLIFYWYTFKNLSSQYYLLFTFILLICYTNASVISLQNPIYIYIYLFIYFNLNKNNNLELKSERVPS